MRRSCLIFVTTMVLFEKEKTSFLNPKNNSTPTLASYVLHDYDVCHFWSQDNLNISSFHYFITKLVDGDEQFLEYCVKYSVSWTVFLFVINFLVLTFGFVGNALVIGVVVWKPRMRTVTNMFILNLAVADLFVVVFCVPANLVANIFIPWIMEESICKAVTYVQGVSVFSSVYSLVALSLDRGKAIYRPMSYPRGLSKSHAVITVALIWLIAVIINYPYFSVFEVVHHDNLPYCQENWADKSHEQIYFGVVHLVLYYILPLVLIIISNAIIWRSVLQRQVAQLRTSTHSTMQEVHSRTRLRVLKMLSFLTLAFFLCWLPLYVVMSVVKFSGENGTKERQEFLEVFIPLAQLLGICNSCANLVLYAFLNRKFRELLQIRTRLRSSSSFRTCCCYECNRSIGRRTASSVDRDPSLTFNDTDTIVTFNPAAVSSFQMKTLPRTL